MKNTSLRAIEALQEAQKIAFAPFVFQATVSLRKLGVFSLIFDRRKNGGITIDDISKELSISAYGIGVLLEVARQLQLQSPDAGVDIVFFDEALGLFGDPLEKMIFAQRHAMLT